MKPATGLLAALLATIIAAPAAWAQELRLKLTHPLPGTHYLYTEALSKFEKLVADKTGGKVQFDVFPAHQLGKDYTTIVKSGIADLAMIIPSNAADKYPLNSVIELPGIYDTSCEGSAMYWKLAQPGGILQTAETGPLGLHVVMVNTLAPYRLMTTGRQIASLKDAEGLKLWAPGAGLGSAMSAFGMIPITIPSTDVPDTLRRGTMDGAAYPYSSIYQYELQKQFRHILENVSFGTQSWMLIMSQDRWAALPAEVQAAITEAGAEIQRDFCGYLDTSTAAIQDRLRGESGLALNALTEDEMALWQAKFDGLGDVWARQADSAGHKGSETLAAMRAAAGN